MKSYKSSNCICYCPCNFFPYFAFSNGVVRMNPINLIVGGMCIGMGVSLLMIKDYKVGAFDILVGILNIIVGFIC